jgi:hypothetical protein
MPRDHEPIRLRGGGPARGSQIETSRRNTCDSDGRADGRQQEPCPRPTGFGRRMLRGRRRSWPKAAATLSLVVLVAGCSGSSGVQDKLLQASSDADAAVHTGVTTLKLLQDGRITHAVAQTALIDMAKEVSKSVDDVAKVDLSRPDDAALRDQVRAATGSGSAAVLAGRDCLQLKISCQAAAGQLQKAAKDLDDIVSQLRGSS